MDKKRIVIVVMSGEFLMDFAGPADVFLQVNKHRDVYDVVLVTPVAGTVIGAGGAQISCSGATDLTGNIDTLLIAGNDNELNHDQFYAWLETAYSHIRRIGAISVGSGTVARLTLLDDKRAATHTPYGAPQVKTDRISFHSRDGNVFTSGGVSSGIDLALAMVAEDCGRGAATDIAHKLIFFYLSRQVYQVQFGNLIAASPVAAQLKEWLAGRLHEPLDVGRLAEHLNMSQRNFTRVFTRQTGISPAKYIEKIRVEAACKCLDETDKPLEEIAVHCGLGGLVSMRRLFLRHLMVTPSEYRRILKLHKNENSN